MCMGSLTRIYKAAVLPVYLRSLRSEYMRGWLTAGIFIDLVWKYYSQEKFWQLECDIFFFFSISSSEIVKQIAVFASVLACPGCHTKLPLTQEPKQQKFNFSLFRRPEVQDQHSWILVTDFFLAYILLPSHYVPHDRKREGSIICISL